MVNDSIRRVNVIVSEQKRQAIKATLKATRDKRKQQRCRVYELKIMEARMSKRAANHLQRLFLEAK
ncbi:MAG: hypothetical protein ACXAEU_00660 [Candidatus Hodarchaeales archaeon]|jgi:hypothetical protein